MLQESVINTCQDCGKKFLGGGWWGLGCLCKKCGSKDVHTHYTPVRTGNPVLDQISRNMCSDHNDKSGDTAARQTAEIDILIDEEKEKGTSTDKIASKIAYKFGGSYDKIKSYIESRNNLKESLKNEDDVKIDWNDLN